MLQPNLAAFMEEILQKYRRYKQQIEMAWMDIVNETLRLLKQFLHFTWKQSEVIIQNFCETEILQANEQRDEKLEAMEKFKEQYEQENESLHGRLKVHYAYQNNRLLLDSLLEAADKIKEKLNIQDVYDWFTSYKDTQDEAKSDFLKRLSCLEEELEKLKSNAFNLVNEKLIEQFEDNIQLNKRKGISSARRERSWITLSDISSRYESLKSQSKASSENRSTASQKITLVSSSSFLPQNVPKNSLMDLNEAIIYKETVTKDGLIKAYDEDISKRVELVKENKKGFDLVLRKWEKIWTTSTEKILKLYTLKYGDA